MPVRRNELGRGGGRSGRSKKGMPNKNSDVRREHSHRSLSVRNVGWEKTCENMDGGVGFPSTIKAEEISSIFSR